MADLGDVSVTPLSERYWHSLGLPLLPPYVPREAGAPNPFGYLQATNNEPASNVCTLTCATGTVVTVLQEGSFVRRSASVAGEAKFYGLPDGVLYAHAAETSQTWRVTVAGTSVTVEELSAGGTPPNVYSGSDGRLHIGQTPPIGGRLVLASTP